MSDGGGGGQTTQVIERSNPEPPALQQPYLSDLYSRAQTAFNATDRTPYAGPFVAGPTAQQQQALTQQAQVAGNLSNAGFGQNVLDLGNRTVAGDYLMPGSNPALQGAIDAAIDPIEQRFLQNTLPAITSGFAQSGAYGGSADANLRQQATNDFTRNALNTAAGVTYSNYAAERDRQMQAPQLLERGAGMLTAPGELLFNIGATQRGFTQDQIANDIAALNEQRNAPWLGIPEYAASIQTGSFGGGVGSRTGAVQPQGNSQWLQGLLGIGGLGLGIASLF